MFKLEYLVTLTQKGLMALLRKHFKGNVAAYKKKKFVLVKGNLPVMLVAHLDTVHKEVVKVICKSADGNIVMSPQGIGGDDRCGVYALLSVYESAKIGKKPWLLFTCDEEIGGHGADEFCSWYEQGRLPKALGNLKMIIEIDRKGSKDAVYYDCDNKDFEDYVTSKGFHTEYGSFSDISFIAPDMGVAAVNLSSGYYYAHTQHEYINRKHLSATIEKVKEMVADTASKDFPRYEYIEKVQVWKKLDENYKSLWNYPRKSYDYYRGYYGDGWGGYDSTLTATEQARFGTQNDEPQPVPPKYRQMYDELCEIMEVDELEEWRRQYGDAVIQELYDEEIMGLYDCDDKENLETPNETGKEDEDTAKK